MRTVSRSLDSGTVIHHRYQILQELGAGGFGITYQVWDLKEDCIAAMKEFMPQDVSNRRTDKISIEAKPGQRENYERFQKKFLDEAQLIYQFQNHPNIVQVRHLFRENNTAYYVMEYLEGKDFGKILKQQGSQMSWEQMKPMISQVVNALSAVHKTGLVHCDISPDNLFVLGDGTVKLIDFGATKNYVKGPSSIIYLKGKFAPPEQQITSGKLGPWTDIYALAVVIYFAYTGKMPPSSMDRMTSDTLVLPSRMGMHVPSSQWEEALEKALELRPEDRYQTVDEFWDALNGGAVHSIPVLDCMRGCYEGYRITFEHETIFGTDGTRCHIQFPAKSRGISRVHMRCWVDENQLMAMDMGSTYGTWLNQKVMTPGLVYQLESGDIIELGMEELFRVAYTERS